MGFNKNAYDQQYKKDKFDHFAFFAPKGTRAEVQKRAESMNMSLSEYFRYLIKKDTQ